MLKVWYKYHFMEVVVDPTGKSARWHALDSGNPGGGFGCANCRETHGGRHWMHVSGPEQFRQFPAVLGALPQKVPGSSGEPPPKGFGQFRAVSGSLRKHFRAV